GALAQEEAPTSTSAPHSSARPAASVELSNMAPPIARPARRAEQIDSSARRVCRQRGALAERPVSDARGSAPQSARRRARSAPRDGPSASARRRPPGGLDREPGAL